MKCVNCGKELPDTAKFCFACGAKQELQAPPEPDTDPILEPVELISEPEAEEVAAEAIPPCFCPYCGIKNDGDAVFCCECGAPLKGFDRADNIGNAAGNTANDGRTDKGTKTKPPKPPKSPKGSGKHTGLKIGIIAAVLAIIGVAAFIVIKLLGGSENPEDKYVQYIKDGRLMSVDTQARKREVNVYGKGLDYNLDYVSDAVKYSDDGKYMYFPSDIAEASYRLNAVRTGSDGEDVIKIDSGVSQYWTLKDSTDVVYLKKDVLYKNDLDGNKEKIASNVGYAFVDINGKYAIWFENDDDKLNYYYRPLDLKSEKVLLCKDGNLGHYSEDFKSLYFYIEDGLYKIQDFGERVKIDENVNIIGVDEDDTLYYAKNMSDSMTSYDLINDDLAEADAAMEEPDLDDYVKTGLENGPNGLEKVETTDYDAYYEAYDRYYEKQYRDSLRESLKENVINPLIKDIYIYKDNESKRIVENVYGETVLDEGLLIYNKPGTDELPKINISEIESAYDAEYIYEEAMNDALESWAYCDGTTYNLGEKMNLMSLFYNKDDHVGYMVTYGDENMTVWALDTDSQSKPKELMTDVTNISGFFGGDFYYITYDGDLYCNDKIIDSDVGPYSVFEIKDTGVICYATGVDDDFSFTLKTFDGKDKKTISKDAYMYRFLDTDRVAVLENYSTTYNRKGDLKLYIDGEEPKIVDEDVFSIIGGKTPYTYY